MKTIKVSDKQYELLKKWKELLNTQDNRGTRDPIYYIKSPERTYGFDREYTDKYVYIFDGEEIAEDDSELFEWLYDDWEKELSKLFGDATYENEFDYEKDIPKDDLKEWFIKQFDRYFDLDDINEAIWCSIEKVYYITSDEIAMDNSFSIFEEDAKNLLEGRRYAYGDKSYTYADTCWRSDNMSKLRDFLMMIEVEDK